VTYVLALEAIGDDRAAHNRIWQGIAREAGMPRAIRKLLDTGGASLGPWVAEIVGLEPRWGFRRVFLRGRKDYSRSNSIGSRGVYVYYELHEGAIYDIHERTSWRSVDRRYARIGDGHEVRMTKDEVTAWLSAD